MSGPRADTEKELIQRLFRPLSRDAKESYGLTDDVAYLAGGTSGHMINVDQVIENTHFFSCDLVENSARKLVRRNLSDIVAKGGRPTGAFLALAWPKSRDWQELERFVQALGEDLLELCDACPLLGGDTSSVDGPLVASLTMLGKPFPGRGTPVLRSGGQAGDALYVTGAIGLSHLGLLARLGEIDGKSLRDCLRFYELPDPTPLKMADVIGRFANASIDISDGFLHDAWQLAQASATGADINLHLLPLHHEVSNWVALQPERSQALMRLATGGDDYQALCAISPENCQAFETAAQHLDICLTRVGTLTSGSDLIIRCEEHLIDLPERLGWSI